MFSTEINIIVKPEDIWEYFIKHKFELSRSMEPVAQNDDYDVIIYLFNEDDMPCLIIESSNVEYEEYRIEDEESCADTVQTVYNLYLTDQIMTVMMEEEEEEAWSQAEREADMIAEREADIDSFIQRFLEDLFSDEPIIYSDLIEDVVEDCKEHFLEYLYRKHGLSVYRPMELEDDEGVFIEEYPYECMEFEPNPLYEEKENK